jgi:hypothetical protein
MIFRRTKTIISSSNKSCTDEKHRDKYQSRRDGNLELSRSFHLSKPVRYAHFETKLMNTADGQIFIYNGTAI